MKKIVVVIIAMLSAFGIYRCSNVEVLIDLPIVVRHPPKLELVEGDRLDKTYLENKEHWERQGCRIMRFSDLYALLGSLTEEQLALLRQDMKESFLFTSELKFDGMMLSCDGREPVECPELGLVPVTQVGERLLQYLFNTKDSREAIVANLCRLSRMEAKSIFFWMPSLDFRRRLPARASGFSYDLGGFHFDGNDDLLNYSGRSRGVRRREAR